MKVHFHNRERKMRFRSETDLVQWMRKHDPEPSRDITDFMEGYKMRKWLFEQITLNTATVNDFVSGLVNNGIISIRK
ncbi:hypothetical protein [Niabella sp.]|uniref:hypothetical protein n=1 Tax=Niabella sp. TaxID=1962976 RepID=UPI00263054C0|nr:hypothetical protein [Niabella sp.]